MDKNQEHKEFNGSMQGFFRGRPGECGLGGNTTKQKTTDGPREACLGEDGPGEVPGKQKTKIGAGERGPGEGGRGKA